MEIPKDLFIEPDIDNSRAMISFTWPENASFANWRILDECGNSVASGNFRATGGEKMQMTVKIPEANLWSIGSPYLYKYELKFDDSPATATNFGMRKIGVCGRDIMVNNQKFCPRGYIRGREAHDHPNLLNLPLREYYEKNIRMAKDYGFNLIRFHSTIPPKECFDAADSLGIFIHIEIRKYFGRYQAKERAKMKEDGEIIDLNEWTENMLAIRNHPSLMFYCIGNEIRHPGCNPFIEQVAAKTKKLDPTRLFIDTCAHGEFDRTYVDFDVQHMSYYYPFGENYDMFENTYNWLIYGSCKGQQLHDSDREDDPAYKITRGINPTRPVIAHEICHYAAYRDLDELERKFNKHAPDRKPWWISELKKLSAKKGYDRFYKRAMEASKRFQFSSWKLGIEGARRSKLLAGFHFLQLSDTDRYENSNGIIDCFDDKTGVSEKEFLKFNGDSVLLADLPKRTYFENEKVKIPIIISHFSDTIWGDYDFSFELTNTDSPEIISKGSLKGINLDDCGLREICSVELRMPECGNAKTLKFTVRLSKENSIIENDWTLWVFPNRPNELPDLPAEISLEEVNTSIRYPQLSNSHSGSGKLMIINRFTDEVFEHLEKGGDVLMLYRVPETRDRNLKCKREKYSLPTAWDRLKAVIWDRGNNCGAFIDKHPAFDAFPHDGFMDLQFYGLINDCDKINLDDFPVEVNPIMRGIDRAVRDRFDISTYQLSELQPEWTMRNFAYAIELKVGKGKLFISAFNFTGLNSNTPETCSMFESFVKYVTSDKFNPKAEIAVHSLKDYLERKGEEPKIKERKMTQYWQLNDEPLESARYWKEAEEYIAGTLKL